MKRYIILFPLMLALSRPVQAESLYPIHVNGKWGYINELAKIVTSPEYDFAFPMENKMGRIMMLKNGQKEYGYVNSDGRLLFHPKFQTAGAFINGFCRIEYQDKWTFINQSGKIITEAQFDEVSDFHDERALVRLNNRYGYINGNGILVINTNFLWATDFRDGLAVVKVKYTPTNSYYPVERYGYIDKKGNYYFEPVYKQARPFLSYRAPVIFEDSSAWTFMDHKGQPLTNLYYSDLGDYHEELARFKSGYYWGYMNKAGVPVINADFSYALDFNGGVAWVNKGAYSSDNEYRGGKWGLINKTGQIILEPMFDRISSFQKGTAVVWKSEQPGLAYINGNYHIYTNLDWIYPFSEGLARIEFRKRFAFMNSNGKIVLNGDYLGASDFNDGLALVLTRDKTIYTKQYINSQGQTIWQDTHDIRRPFKKDDVLTILADPGLDLKKEANLESKTIYQIPYGETVIVQTSPSKKTVIEADGLYGHWIEVMYHGSKGFLFTPYLSKLPAPLEGMGFKQYFDLKMGRINTASLFQLKKREVFHYAAVRETEYKYNSSESTYTILGPNMQEMSVIIKAALGFTQMPLPESTESQRKGKDYLSITVSRNNTTELKRIHFAYSGPRGNERIELIAIQPNVLKIIHNYSF